MDPAVLDAKLETVLLQSSVATRVQFVQGCTRQREYPQSCVCPNCDTDRQTIKEWMVRHWDEVWEAVT